MTISAKALGTPATMTPTLLVVLVGILLTGSEGRDSERESKKIQSIVSSPAGVGHRNCQVMVTREKLRRDKVR